MVAPKFCAECGEPTTYERPPYEPNMGEHNSTVCSDNREHNVEVGGFFCPDCGDATSGDHREGTRCMGCSTPY